MWTVLFILGMVALAVLYAVLDTWLLLLAPALLLAVPAWVVVTNMRD